MDVVEGRTVEATVHVYTGEQYQAEAQTWPTEPLEGDASWDEGGVRVQREDKKGTQVWQIPWTSVKYITWRKERQG